MGFNPSAPLNRPCSPIACVSLVALLVCAISAPAPSHDHTVELVNPSHEWTTFAGEGGGRVLRTVSRQSSTSSNLVGNSPIAYTVRRDSNCVGCESKHKSEFSIDVVKPPDAAVQEAIEKAVYVMEHSWHSKVPVNARVAFGNLGAPEILANGGGTFFCRIRSMFDEILPIAAGEAILGRDLNEHKDDKGKYDVLITINTNAPWYFGIDGKPPRHSYDLVTVLLHEMYHNLLFTGGIYVTVQKTKDKIVQKAHVHKNLVTRFDAFLANEQGCSVLTYLKDRKLKDVTGLSGVELLAAALSNDRLYFGWEAHGGLVKLHAPRIFVPKSSIYHLSPSHADGDVLMTPKFLQGKAQHRIGSRILKMQHLYLDPDVKGANDKCSRPLRDPRGSPITPEERSGFEKHEENHHHPPLVSINHDPFDVPVYGGFPVGWIVALSILGVILLLTLCALLFCILYKLKKRNKGTSVSSSVSSSDLYRGAEGPPPQSGGAFGGGGGVMPGGPPPAEMHSYRTPSRSRSNTNGYPQPPPGAYSGPPPLYPSKPSSKRPSSTPKGYKPSSHRPSSHKPSSKSPSRHSSKRPPSTRPPSHRPKSCPPKTEDYFDCT